VYIDNYETTPDIFKKLQVYPRNSFQFPCYFLSLLSRFFSVLSLFVRHLPLWNATKRRRDAPIPPRPVTCGDGDGESPATTTSPRQSSFFGKVSNSSKLSHPSLTLSIQQHMVIVDFEWMSLFLKILWSNLILFFLWMILNWFFLEWDCDFVWRTILKWLEYWTDLKIVIFWFELFILFVDFSVRLWVLVFADCFCCF
jgi:hypothetical protein